MLGPEVQGEWTLYINAFTFGLIAFGIGLPPAINHYLAANKIDRKFLLGQLFTFSVFVTIMFFLVLFLLEIIGLGSVFLPQIGSPYFVLFGLAAHLLLLVFNQLLAAVLLADRRFVTAARISAFAALGLLLLYAILYLLDWQLAQRYFLFFIIANLIILLLQMVFYARSILKDERYSLVLNVFRMKTIRLLISFALLAYITNFLQFLNYKMDIWFINAYVYDDAKLGIYAIAVSLSQLIWLVPNAFHAVIFTDVSADTSQDQKHKVEDWARKMLFVAVGCGLIGYLLATWLVPYLFGIRYTYIISVIPYLLPGIILFAPTILLSAFLAGRNRVDLNLKASAIGFILALVGNCCLIPSYGIIGAACATSISYSFSSIYTYYCFLKQV